MPVPIETKPVEKKPGQSLSDIAFISRQVIKFGAIGIVLLIVGRVALNTSVSIWKSLNPPKPPPPTIGFGVLPPLAFPASNYDLNTITLQTRTGGFELRVPEALPVYAFIPQALSLLSVNRATQRAAALGFAFTPEEISPTAYRWRRNSPIPSTLDLNIVTSSFEIQSDWASNVNLLNPTNLPQQNAAIASTRGLLQSADLLPADMATGEAKVVFLRALGTEFQPALSASDAEFVQVDLFRTRLFGEFPVFRDNPLQGNARFVYSGGSSRTSVVVEASFQANPIDYSRYETYPVIPVEQAWQQLQSGKGFVANLDPFVRDVIVRNVFLAYYDGSEDQQFLQPIYVFTGDRNFYGYVPALASLTPQSESSQ